MAHASTNDHPKEEEEECEQTSKDKIYIDSIVVDINNVCQIVDKLFYIVIIEQNRFGEYLVVDDDIYKLGIYLESTQQLHQKKLSVS